MKNNFLIAAGEQAFEIFLWLGIVLAWIVIQAISTAGAKKRSSKQTEDTGEKPANLDDFMEDMFSRAKEQAKPVQQARKTASYGVKKAHLKKTKQSIQEKPETQRPSSPQKPVSSSIRKRSEQSAGQFRSTQSLLGGGTVYGQLDKLHVPKIRFTNLKSSMTYRKLVPSPLISNIKSPRTLKQAVLYSEILGRPKGSSGLKSGVGNF